MRTTRQIAARAVVQTAVAFRASLEVTDHLRAKESSDQILGWLTTNKFANEMESFERDILMTEYGRLHEDQMRDAVLSGEAAWVCAWAVSLAPRPKTCERTDINALVNALDILQNNPAAALSNCQCRSESELIDYCLTMSGIRNSLQRRHVTGQAKEILLQHLANRLGSIGLVLPPELAATTDEIVEQMSDDERRTASGLCFVRELPAMWLLSNSGKYCEADE